MAGRSRSRGGGGSRGGRGHGNVSFRQENRQEQEQQEEQPQENPIESLRTLSPDHFWFGRRCVSNAIGDSIRHYYRAPYMNWTETPESVKNRWFNNFRNSFKWEKELDRRVRDGYDEYTAKRLKGIVSHAGKLSETNGKKPKWISETVYAELKKKRQEGPFQEKSKRASDNKRASAEDGVIPSTHHMGSISALETALKMTKANQGKLPATPDVFFRIHSVIVDTNGKRELKRKKDKEVYARYEEKLNEVGENEDRELENQDTENQVAENAKKDAVFFDVVGGRKKR